MRKPDALRVKVSTAEVQGELAYHLLTDAIVIEGECVPVYGVSIAFMSVDGICFDKMHNVTPDKENMLDFMEKMAQGTVFPISLVDVIEDFIA